MPPAEHRRGDHRDLAGNRTQVLDSQSGEIRYTYDSLNPVGQRR